MPANSRCHVVDEFNEGRYSYIIASDVSGVLAERDTQEGQWPQNDEVLFFAFHSVYRRYGIFRRGRDADIRAVSLAR